MKTTKEPFIDLNAVPVLKESKVRPSYILRVAFIKKGSRLLLFQVVA